MNFLLYIKSALLWICMLLILGCSDDEALDCASAALSIYLSNVVDASCGLNNGSFEISVSGGQSPYEFSLTGTDFQILPSSSSRIETMAPGNYQLALRDANGCEASTSVIISNQNLLSVSTAIMASGCGTADGSIAFEVAGGKEPYLFSLDGGTKQTDSTFSGLTTGAYSALITDQGSCQTSLMLHVSSGTSYKEDIFPIIELNCAIADCHDGSDTALPDWTEFTNVQSLAGTIKQRTSNETMPPPGSPDLKPSEIQAIACWVDDGALNN